MSDGDALEAIPAPWEYPGILVRWVDGDSAYVIFEKEIRRTIVEDFGFGFSTAIEMVETRSFTPDGPIRLYGIDTPETRGPKAKTEKAAGDRATARAKELVPPGTRALFRSHKLRKGGPAKGKYGRYLIEVFPLADDGAPWESSVNKILVEEGHAKPYFGGKR